MSFLVGELSQPGATMANVNLQLPPTGSPELPSAPVAGGTTSIDAVAGRLAGLLMGDQVHLDDAAGSELEFEPVVTLRPLGQPEPTPEVWAVDGGQALVADARCLQVVVTRSAAVCFRHGRCEVEEVGDLRAHLLGAGSSHFGLGEVGLKVEEGTPVDINLLRDWAEWVAARACVDRAVPGSLILLDGDLVPDWRSPAGLAAALFEAAEARGVTVVGLTKHSSLSRGGAPLVGQLELEAARELGRRRWWAPVARTKAGSRWPDIRVVVAGLDPDSRYAFRIDLPAGADPEPALAKLASVSNDAAFPGYPYPLSVADRLAACPGWVRAEAWLALDEALERAGVDAGARQRAFDDRHRLMERA